MGARLRRVIPIAGFTLLFPATTIYRFLAGTEDLARGTEEYVFQALLGLCYGCLWWLIDSRLTPRRPGPPQIFWHVFLATLAAGVLVFVVTLIPGLTTPTGEVLSAVVHIENALLSLLVAALGFAMVIRFRDLVRFRRTRSSERNWRIMLLLMVLGACSMYAAGDLGLAVPEVLPLMVLPAGALAYIVINALRVGWVVRLPTRKKGTTIGGACLVLAIPVTVLTLESMTAADLGLDPLPLVYGALHFSLPLGLFVGFCLIFGFLYAVTSVLSLVFHLPTVGDMRRSTDEIAAMQSLTTLVRDAVDSDKLLNRVVALPVEAGRANAAWIAMMDISAGSLAPTVVAANQIDPGRAAEVCDTAALHREVIRTRKALVVQHAAAHPHVRARARDSISSLAVVPLAAHDRVLGSLFVSRDVVEGFEEDDLEAISALTAQATLALDNARLIEQKIERERLASELAIARAVQQRLLPNALPALRRGSLAASSISAQEVGGDFYDALELDDDRVAFIVADVSGKGTSAAFYMAELQGVFHGAARTAPAPDAFLRLANAAMSTILERRVFVTVAYGIIHQGQETLYLGRAGHCSALLLDSEGVASHLRPGGMGIGLDPGLLFDQSLTVLEHSFRPGDVVVIYTDGVLESRNGTGEEYGEERLIRATRASRHEHASALHDALHRDIDEFLGPQTTYMDDLTLLVIKWHESAPIDVS